jgi:hypothetical protein
VDVFVDTTVGPHAEPVLGAFGFHRVPAGNWQEAGFWITNYSGFVPSALKTRRLNLPGALSHPGSALLSGWDKLRGARLPRESGAFELDLCSRFDGSFDEFWEELCRQSPRVLLAVRNRETLEWHFGARLARREAWVVTARRGGQLMGYAVFDRHDRADLGMRRVRVLDFQAAHDTKAVSQDTLGWLVRHCRENGVHVLESIGGWLDRLPGIKGVAYRRRLPSWLYYYKAPDAALSARLRQPEVWAPTSYDGDATL